MLDWKTAAQLHTHTHTHIHTHTYIHMYIKLNTDYLKNHFLNLRINEYIRWPSKSHFLKLTCYERLFGIYL